MNGQYLNGQEIFSGLNYFSNITVMNMEIPVVMNMKQLENCP